MSYADADFYHVGNLQADHLQPSNNIVARQLELIEAMNIDPIFKAQMLSLAEGKGYFIINRDEVCGLKRFFMEYHNCVDNLWLLTTAAGTRKGDMDPILWLRNHELFGDDFITSLGGVDKSCILYTNSGGVVLAEAARTWFRHRYEQQITAVGYVTHRIREPLVKQVEQTMEQRRRKRRGSKQQSIELMARMTVAGHLAAVGEEKEKIDDSQYRGQSSSPHSSDAEIKKRNLKRMEQVLEEDMPFIEARIGAGVKAYKDKAKRRRKAESIEKGTDIGVSRLTGGGK